MSTPLEDILILVRDTLESFDPESLGSFEIIAWMEQRIVDFENRYRAFSWAHGPGGLAKPAAVAKMIHAAAIAADLTDEEFIQQGIKIGRELITKAAKRRKFAEWVQSQVPADVLEVLYQTIKVLRRIGRGQTAVATLETIGGAVMLAGPLLIEVNPLLTVAAEIVGLLIMLGGAFAAADIKRARKKLQNLSLNFNQMVDKAEKEQDKEIEAGRPPKRLAPSVTPNIRRGMPGKIKQAEKKTARGEGMGAGLATVFVIAMAGLFGYAAIESAR